MINPKKEIPITDINYYLDSESSLIRFCPQSSRSLQKWLDLKQKLSMLPQKDHDHLIDLVESLINTEISKKGKSDKKDDDNKKKRGVARGLLQRE